VLPVPVPVHLLPRSPSVCSEPCQEQPRGRATCSRGRALPTPSSLAPTVLLDQLRASLAQEQQAHCVTRQELEREAEVRCAKIDASWRSVLAAREIQWRRELDEVRRGAAEEIVQADLQAGARERAAQARHAEAEVECQEVTRSLTLAEVELRKLRSGSAATASGSLQAEQRLEVALADGRRHQREASDLKLTVEALTERCKRLDQTSARLRTEASMASSVGGLAAPRQGPGGIPRPAAAPLHESQRGSGYAPRARGGALGAMARGLRHAESLDSVPEDSQTRGGLERSSDQNPERSFLPEPAVAACDLPSRSSSACSLFSVASSAASSVAPTGFDAFRRGSDRALDFGLNADAPLLDDLLAEISTPSMQRPHDWSSVPPSPAASEVSVSFSGFTVARSLKLAAGIEGHCAGGDPG